MNAASIYSSLTMPQRLRAMVSAFGRSDHDEVDRLVDTSPDGCGSIRKVKYHFGNLSHLAAIHNSFLLEPCAEWLFSQTFSPEETRDLSAKEREAVEITRTKSLVDAASVEAAFTGRITEEGISASDWKSFRERLLDRGAKFLLEELLCKAAGYEDPALVAQYKDAIEGYLFKDAA